MDNYMETDTQELERLARRKARREQMLREKQLQMRRRRKIKKLLLLGGRVGLTALILGITGLAAFSFFKEKNMAKEGKEQVVEAIHSSGENGKNYTDSIVSGQLSAGSQREEETNNISTQIIQFRDSSDKKYIYNEEIISSNAILIDIHNNIVVAGKEERARISPASMTKVLTLLVAAEHIKEEQLEDTFAITREITDYGFINDCSNVGFLEGERVTLRDLFYGTILCSGADAALGLATYVAGSHEAFVELMNNKLKDLGLDKTSHFTNCVGIYNENHYSTVYDMAVIMKAAISHDFCKEVLGARTYTTKTTPEHPEGISISNWFLRRIEDKETGGPVLGAKTGFVNQSGSCAVSYGSFKDGSPYICVTVGAHSSWRCIYDHVEIYNRYVS